MGGILDRWELVLTGAPVIDAARALRGARTGEIRLGPVAQARWLAMYESLGRGLLTGSVTVGRLLARRPGP